MPGPWGVQRPQFNSGRKARPIEACAMKLRHLRNLEQYIQRLCKTGLLKYPDHHFNRSRGKAGKPVKWSVIAQHEITSEIIKRIIPEEHSCSWSEMISPDEPQETDRFCSHSWSEAFREFMTSIERFVEECDATDDTGFWSELPPPCFALCSFSVLHSLRVCE
jgi:hypothetical protein